MSETIPVRSNSRNKLQFHAYLRSEILSQFWANVEKEDTVEILK